MFSGFQTRAAAPHHAAVAAPPADCNRECQRRHWKPVHKAECKGLARRRERQETLAREI